MIICTKTARQTGKKRFGRRLEKREAVLIKEIKCVDSQTDALQVVVELFAEKFSSINGVHSNPESYQIENCL